MSAVSLSQSLQLKSSNARSAQHEKKIPFAMTKKKLYIILFSVLLGLSSGAWLRNRAFLDKLLRTIDAYPSSEDNWNWDRHVAKVNGFGVTDVRLLTLRSDYVYAYQNFQGTILHGVERPPKTSDQAYDGINQIFSSADVMAHVHERASSLARFYGVKF